MGPGNGFDRLGVIIGVGGIATFQEGLALGLFSQVQQTGINNYMPFLDKNSY